MAVISAECITVVQAYDPDKSTGDDEISYFLNNEQAQPSLSIDQKGCLKILQPFDRDPPNGFAEWQVKIFVNRPECTKYKSSNLIQIKQFTVDVVN